MGGEVGQAYGTATGVAVEMESREAGFVGDSAYALDLHCNVVVSRGRYGSEVKFEVLGDWHDVGPQLLEQGCIAKGARHDNPRKKDDARSGRAQGSQACPIPTMRRL